MVFYLLLLRLYRRLQQLSPAAHQYQGCQDAHAYTFVASVAFHIIQIFPLLSGESFLPLQVPAKQAGPSKFTREGYSFAHACLRREMI